MNLNIYEHHVNVHGEVTEIHWRLNIGSGICDTAGWCRVRDGRVETPQLCKGAYVDLRPSAALEIHTACQEWLDEKPERDRKDRETLVRLVRVVWEKWEAYEKNVHQREYHAIPSIDHLPADIAVEGECYFMACDDEGREWSSPPYHNPTWADVMRAFENSMEFTDDYHHVFLEGIYEKHGAYRFSTGS